MIVYKVLQSTTKYKLNYLQTLLPNNFKNYVGMPLLPILFSTGVPNIPVLPHSATPKGVKLKKLSSTIFLLYPNPFKSYVSKVEFRRNLVQINKIFIT